MTFFSNETFLESKEFPFHIHTYHLTSHNEVPTHAHQFFEFVYIFEGQATHIYAENAYPIKKGDIFVIEPGVEHTYVVEDTEEVTVYNLLFHPTLLTAELEALAKMHSFVHFFYLEPFMRKRVTLESHLSLPPVESIEINWLLDMIVKEFEQKKEGYQLVIKAQIIQLFVRLSRLHEEQFRKSSALLLGSDKEVIEAICQYLKVYFHLELSLEDISRMSGMSRSKFSSIFKKWTGQTLTEYRNKLRLQIAQELLRQTEKKIIDIANHVGFNDLSFFHRSFKEFTGLAPGQYRKKYMDRI